FSLTRAKSSSAVEKPKSPRTAYVGVRLLGDTCRQTCENGSMLSLAIEYVSRVATRMLARMQAITFVSATATTILVMTGPTCWVMISSIGAAELASTAAASLMAST